MHELPLPSPSCTTVTALHPQTLKTKTRGRRTTEALVHLYSKEKMGAPVFVWPPTLSEDQIMNEWIEIEARGIDGARPEVEADGTSKFDPLRSETLRAVRERAVGAQIPAESVLRNIRLGCDDTRKGELLVAAFRAQLITTNLLCTFVATGRGDWDAFVALGGTHEEVQWRARIRQASDELGQAGG